MGRLAISAFFPPPPPPKVFHCSSHVASQKHYRDNPLTDRDEIDGYKAWKLGLFRGGSTLSHRHGAVVAQFAVRGRDPDGGKLREGRLAPRGENRQKLSELTAFALRCFSVREPDGKRRISLCLSLSLIDYYGCWIPSRKNGLIFRDVSKGSPSKQAATPPEKKSYHFSECDFPICTLHHTVNYTLVPRP